MKDFRKVLVEMEISVDNPLYNEDAKFKYFDHPFIKERRVSNKVKLVGKPYKFEGWFHCWGSVVYEDEGVGTNTVAVVEDNMGKIYTPSPEDIRFIDR